MEEKQIELDELIHEIFIRSYGEPVSVVDNLHYFYFYVGCLTMTRFWCHHKMRRHEKDIAHIRKDLETLGDEPNKDLLDLYVEMD